MRIRMMMVCRTALICCLASTLPAVSQSPQQQPSTRPAPPPRPSKPSGDVSIQPYPNPPKPGPTPRPPGQNPGQRPPGSNPGSNPGARPPSRPPSRPSGDVTIQPYPYPPKPSPRPPRPPTWGRPPQYRPPYQWRPGDWDYLHRYYYRNLGYINRSRRPSMDRRGIHPVDGLRISDSSAATPLRIPATSTAGLPGRVLPGICGGVRPAHRLHRKRGRSAPIKAAGFGPERFLPVSVRIPPPAARRQEARAAYQSIIRIPLQTLERDQEAGIFTPPPAFGPAHALCVGVTAST